MYFVIGLGNPGSEYCGTRHNLGFDVIDAIAEKESISLHEGKGDYLIGFLDKMVKEVAIVKPLTYMNNSGIAVKQIIEGFDIPLEKLIVISDDFNLPLGTIRIRTKGSDGGHNGLFSIIYHLQSNVFTRIRCGIAGNTKPDNKSLMSEYVLSRFEKDEIIRVKKMVEEVIKALYEIINNGVQRAMNLFNKRV